ncbi:hypothetical protein Mesci_5929 [Mesorhizobium ciceri biovar biserrulae WSM1271]|uniref:Uncharacterized protein n=1 Tax=Mesorhizobium ciceri biovar biserrulae (strain HAMBI 2942 / LMG 23838 / WSM1271) TaxID=765698 RepID=E8TJS5_MESCW|nr:hypothetical protein Mesci_5929 [Mesorhizobium ciceri biovar biserrulae WSM1271]
MTNLNLSPDYYAVSDAAGLFQNGVIFHISRNRSGGSVSTPVGRFYVSRPEIPPEGYFPHCRLDCYVDDDSLSPEAAWLARVLLDKLILAGAASEPIWLSWHQSNELGGEHRGEVFDFD